MELVRWFVDFVLHLDKNLALMVQNYGLLVYGFLFLIIFCETGLVVMPILPGDSLLFAAGAIAATGDLNPWIMMLLLSIAAILGDTVNYWIGAYLGPKVFKKPKSLFFNPEHLQKTHAFFEKYGGKTIIIARFLPIIRTFAPFVAGIGAMSYRKFIAYNVIGGVLWVFLLVGAGFYFANIEFVKKNFTLVIFAIIILSLLPMVVELIRHKLRRPPPAA
ncbi:MAG: DedA family protein [Kiritimatiellaeota bacterium]|nr:DedA family protein [Kiritimatiellota bacterium]